MSAQSSGPRSPAGLPPRDASAKSAASTKAPAAAPGKASLGAIATRRIAGKLAPQQGAAKPTVSSQADGLAARVSSSSSNVTVR